MKNTNFFFFICNLNVIYPRDTGVFAAFTLASLQVYSAVELFLQLRMYLGALLHFLHHPLMLLGNGQRGRVDPLVDHLPLPRLEREQTLACVTHPAPGTDTQTERNTHTLIALTLGLLIYKYACLNTHL